MDKHILCIFVGLAKDLGLYLRAVASFQSAFFRQGKVSWRGGSLLMQA